MGSRLTVSERRLKMLKYIIYRKEVTYRELSEEFDISLCTVWRDIVFLSKYSTIYTEQGHGGGIKVLQTDSKTKKYLSDKEELCLYKLIEKVSEEDGKTLKGIIMRFSKDFS